MHPKQPGFFIAQGSSRQQRLKKKKHCQVIQGDLLIP